MRLPRLCHFKDFACSSRSQGESNLTIGQFSFSEQDLVLPVNGIPITITRTYNSLNPRAADFGYSWTYALNSMDVELNEWRETITVGGADAISLDPFEDIYPGPQRTVSIRAGGGHDVTLTLPDGRRTTFAFDPKFRPEDYQADARWKAPPGVTEKLELLGGESGVINFIPTWPPYWQSGGFPSTFENHDISGWKLTALDGTEYHLTRGEGRDVLYQDEPGHFINVKVYDAQPKLEWIVQKSGDKIHITDTGLFHYNATNGLTRSMFMQRDSAGRVVAIFDPNSGVTNQPSALNSQPLVKYVYNRDTGNLIQVHRLQDRTAGNYLVTKYHYDHAKFPHYLTSIEDSKGIPRVRNLYDDSGRLVGIIDASGKTNRFEHDINGRREIQYDRSGQPTVFTYDPKGNVIGTMDALGHTNQFLYDDNGYLTNSVNALGHATSFVNDTNGNPLSVTLPYPVGADPANYTTHYTYNPFGEQTSVRLPSGGVITNEFDPDTGLLLAVKDGAGNVISATVYNELNLPKTETDRFGSLHYVYDAMGNLARMTNSLNQVTESRYDLNGNLTNLVDGASTSTIAYDAMNRETSADYGNGITVDYGHDGEGDWSTVEGPTLGHMERKMDEQGRLAGWETANGSSPGFAYDVNGRLEYETNSIGVVTRTVYNAVGWVTATTNLTTGAWAAYDYDAAGQRTVVTNALGFTTRYDYYPSGSMKAMTNAFGTNVWLYTDAAGACASCGSAGTVTDPLGRTVEAMQTPYGLPVSTVWRSGSLVSSNFIEYLAGMTTEEQEAEEYPVAITDEGNRTRRYDYDDLGRLYRATDLSGATWWTNQFDVETGALTNVLSPTGEKLSYMYDDLDNVQSIRFGDGNSLTNFYNQENRLSGVRLPSGVLLTNFYDFAGRLTNRTSTIGETNTFEYNGNDAVMRMTDQTGGTTNLYDAAGRMWGIDYPSGASVRYQLDVLGRIVGITNKAAVGGSAYVTRYQYDPIGNVTNVVDPFSGNTKFEYDRVGRKTKRTLPNGIVTTWDYNWRDQVTNIVHKTSGGTTLASVLYERLPGGEPSKITREDGTFVELKYDAALRLTNEVYYNVSSVPQATNSYGYDASGNRIRFVQPGLTLTNSVSGGYQITAVKNALNGSTTNSYGYDSGGRVTTITRDSATLNLGYNSADQVQAVTNGATWVTYTHDASGRRTFATNNASVVRKFLVAATPGTDLESPQLIANASGTVQQGYVYLGDDPILRYGTGGTVAYYLEDGMGSVIGLAPASSPSTANTTRLFYDGFGNTRTTAGPAPTIPTGTGGDFRFHGAWLEEQSGLYNMRAREYDARMGRFTSRDPRNGVFQRAETLNPYAFAVNNPHVFTDPSGEFTVTEITATDAINTSFEALRNIVISEAKGAIKQKLSDAFGRILVNSLDSFFPGVSDVFGPLLRGQNPGTAFEKILVKRICRIVPGSSVLDHLSFYPGIKEDGTAVSDGVKCPAKIDFSFEKDTFYPDFILGEGSPTEISDPQKAAGKSILLGDIKISGNALFNQYVRDPEKRKQLHAIGGYAHKHTHTRVGLFLTLYSGERSKMKQVGSLIQKEGAKDGALIFVVSAVQNKKY